MSRRHWSTLISSLWPEFEIHPNYILYKGAMSLSLVNLAKEWGATDFNKALSYAAQKGHIDCMKLLKAWGATGFNKALEYAAYGGQIACMKLAKE